MSRRPLEGLRVLDLGTRIAAPFCAGILGEQGAEVIKIEQPHGGDPLRDLGPFVETEDGPYSLILDQVTNGVAVRMAVLYLLTGGHGKGDKEEDDS